MGNRLEELYSEINDVFLTFKFKHAKFVDTANKTSENDARNAIRAIKRMASEYIKESVKATKALKNVK